MNNYYIYFHINPLKNQVFYVGKGKDKRAFKKDRSNYWINYVKKYGYIIDIVEDNLTEQEAFERETFYIKKIGRKDLGLGSLINRTNGGEGISGLKHKEESKKRTPEFCKLMSELKKGVGLGKKKGSYNKGGYNKKSIKCIYDNNEYECLKDLWIDKFINMKYGTFKDHIRKNKIEGLIRLDKNKNTK
jgi:hypothetical protein